MTVQTSIPTPAEVMAADHRAELAPMAPVHAQTVEYLRSWSDGLRLIGEQIAPLIWTDIVPLHHWPLPKGMSLSSFPNPRIRHPQETDEEYLRRQQGAAASATAVAMRGASLGMDPFVALADMWNIRGKLGMLTKLRNAIAKSRGIKTGDREVNAESATCWGVDPLTGETVEITITMADAERAGWTKSNDNYTKNPADMLWSRAMGRVLDRVAYGVLAGIASVEDLRDERTIEGVVVTPAPTTKVTVEQLQSAAAAASAPAEPTLDVDPPAPEMIDQATWKAINREWQRLGVSGPGSVERRLGGIVRMIGRDIAGGSQLTAAEATVVLDTLSGIKSGEPELVTDLLGETPEPNAPAEDDLDPTGDPAFPAVEPQDGPR